MDDELTPRTARRVRFKLETQNISTESDPLVPKVQPVIKHEQSAIAHEPTNPRCKIAPPSSKLLDYWVEKIAYLLSAFPIFDPHSRFRLLWNVIVFISIFYNCFAIPARIAFRDLWSHQDLYKFYVMDYICDFIYLFDLILNFRTEYNDRGVIVDDPHLVVKHYLKGWFVYDFISVLPLDLFYWRPLEHAFLRVNRMLKLGRSNYYFHLWQFHTKHLHLVLFAKFLAYFLILDQWMACLYVALSYQEKFENDYIVPDTYVDQGFVEKYFYSFYWSTTVLVDVGAEGDHVFTQLEIYFTLFMAYLVLFIGAGITATVVDIVRNLRKQRVQFKNRLALINEFLESKEIPHHLQKSIKHYYFYIWSKQKGVDENEILEQLPRKLRTEVSLFMNGSIIKKVPLFKKANQGFICELVDYLNSEIYSPGEFIVKKGEVNSNMFFIHEGALEVVGSSGECCSMLGEGGHFGEIGLLSESTSQVSVRAVTHCDVYVLNKIDLEKVLNCFPEQKEIFMRTAIVRATRDSLIKHARDLLMFSKVSHSFLRDFVDSFHSVTVESGEFLYKCDEAPERMYYFSKGRIELIDSLDKVTNVLELGQSIEEGCLLGHINLALGMKQFVGAKTSNKSNKCILLAIESAKFKSLLKNYPEDAEKVMRGAECHRDRACAIFGRPSAFSRPAKVLWRLALLRLRGMRLWHQSLKVKMNREWLETTKVLENELQTNNMNSSQIEKSLMLLNQCEAKLIKSFSSRTNTQEKKIVMLKDLKQFS